MNSPKITVLMPVYNGEKYLKESIESILNQVFSDFEFLIVDDGSTDRSEEIIKKYQEKDSRVKLIKNKKEKGIVGALNTGLEESHGKYIARMDCDDVCLSERLSRQFRFMEENPEVGVCGAAIRLFGKTQMIVRNPASHNLIKCHLLFYNALAHPTAMIRLSFFEKFKLRYESYPHAEDFELWTKCSFLFKLHNVPEVLLKYRISSDNITIVKKDVSIGTVHNIFREKLELLGIGADEEILALHKSIGDKVVFNAGNELKKAGMHLFCLWTKNRQHSIYPKKEFAWTLFNFWGVIVLKARVGVVKKAYYLVVFPLNLLFSKFQKNKI